MIPTQRAIINGLTLWFIFLKKEHTNSISLISYFFSITFRQKSIHFTKKECESLAIHLQSIWAEAFKTIKKMEADGFEMEKILHTQEIKFKDRHKISKPHTTLFLSNIHASFIHRRWHLLTLILTQGLSWKSTLTRCYIKGELDSLECKSFIFVILSQDSQFIITVFHIKSPSSTHSNWKIHSLVPLKEFNLQKDLIFQKVFRKDLFLLHAMNNLFKWKALF